MDLTVSPEDIFEEALKNFKRQLNERQVQAFCHATILHFQAQIIQVQAEQERNRTMIDFTRLQSFLEKFGQFEEACNTLQISILNLSGYIWGPSLAILQVSFTRCQPRTSNNIKH